MVKIYACSDIHSEFNRFYPKEPVDAILCAGDLTDFGNLGNFSFKETTKWLHQMGTKAPTFYIPGNHDIGLGEVNLAPLWHTNILNREIWFENLLLYGASLCVCYDMPDLANTWENMTCNPMAEEAYYSDIPKCDILLSHSPPSGITGTDKKYADIGSSSLRSWIEKNQPKLVICGHVHEPKKREEYIGTTRVVNVARQGLIVEVD